MEVSLHNDQNWNGLKHRLEKYALGISGTAIPIEEIPIGVDEIGFTADNKVIHLSRFHPLIQRLSSEYQSVFISGVFAHELMHLLDTDFKALRRQLDKLNSGERKIFSTIFNCLEDPAIEYWASYYFGGTLLKTLRFSVKYIYENTSPINPKKKPFTQFISAIIHYGDGGFVKGNLCDEAKSYFTKSLPILDKAIEEPDGALRVKYAKQIFDLSKPLWQSEADTLESIQKLLQELAELMKGNGKGDTSKLSCDPLGDREKEHTPDASSQGKKTKRKSTSDLFSGKASAQSSETADSSDSDTHSADELTADDLKTIRKEIEQSAEELKKEATAKEQNEKVINTANDLSDCYPNVRCLNLKGKDYFNQATYNQVVSSMSEGINSLVSRLNRLFINDRENREYKTSGRLNIKRLSGNRLTSRVFERKIEPSNKSDISILLVVDVSGSMIEPVKGSARKIELARNAAIGLAEVFYKLKIPVSLMTFSADHSGHDVVHTHYLNFNNRYGDRMSLMNVEAGGNNFDGYSIRAAGKIMAKRKEEHKIIVVISDGQPNCRYYYQTNGIADTKNAVRDAGKKATVIGVAIDSDAEILHNIYGEHFIHIIKVQELFEQLGEKIKKEIEQW